MQQLALLNSFVSVIENGSFTGAAKQLGKTKAMISRQVTQLEQELGVRLLNRSTRSNAITDEGRIIYERARHILDEVAGLQQLTTNSACQLSGRLRISAPQTYGEAQLMAQLTQFMHLHSQLKIDLQLNDRFVDIVEEGFDVAIRIGQLPDSNLIARKVGEVPTRLVASPTFLTRHPAITSPDDLTNLPCIHDSNRRGGSKWQFSQSSQSFEVKINPVLTVNSALAATNAAINHIGVTIVPEFAIKQALAEQQLEILLPDYDTGIIGVYAVYPHRQHLTKKVSEFIDYLQQHMHL